MARLGAMSSESVSPLSTGLASILHDQKGSSFLSLNGQGTVSRTELPSVQPASRTSSPESYHAELDIVEDLDEFKEEDVWAAESRSWQQQDLPKPFVQANGDNGMADSSFAPIEKQNQAAIHNSSVFSKPDMDGTNLGGGLKAKKWATRPPGEIVIGMGKQTGSAGEVVRSSSRRDKETILTDVLVNAGQSSFSTPSNGSLLRQIKMACRPTPSRLIPQHRGGVVKHSSRRHAERQSAPVEVPDWSKIMAAKHKGKAMVIVDDRDYGDNDAVDDDDDDRLPPHELLAKEYARSERTTFSVCEGQGRTLKGRDLSRVRDAVWSQMGFAD